MTTRIADIAADSQGRLTAGGLLLLASLAALGALATNIMLLAFPAMAHAFDVNPGDLAWTRPRANHHIHIQKTPFDPSGSRTTQHPLRGY